MRSRCCPAIGLSSNKYRALLFNLFISTREFIQSKLFQRAWKRSKIILHYITFFYLLDIDFFNDLFFTIYLLTILLI